MSDEIPIGTVVVDKYRLVGEGVDDPRSAAVAQQPEQKQLWALALLCVFAVAAGLLVWQL